MTQVARISFSTVILLSAGILLALHPSTLFVSSAFLWLGGIQILNAAAPFLPGTVARFVHWAHALTFEVFAVLAVGVLRFIPVREKAIGKGRPILLVHGYLNHGSVWYVPKKRFEALGFGPVYTINLGHPFRSIQQYAEKVKAKAEAIAKETGRNDLILIGHSMGGLISAWYATQLAPPDTVTDIVTLACPFAGTPIARIAVGQSAREMEPNSPLIKQIHTAIDQSKQIQFYHIATKSDHLVIPGYTAMIPHHPHFIFEDIGHQSLLYSTRVATRIAKWLQKD